MRVLVIIQYFWPEKFRINAIVESLVEHDVKVDVLTGKPNYSDAKVFSVYRIWGCQKEQWKGSTIYCTPLIPKSQKRPIGLVLNYLSFVFSCNPSNFYWMV